MKMMLWLTVGLIAALAAVGALWWWKSRRGPGGRTQAALPGAASIPPARTLPAGEGLLLRTPLFNHQQQVVAYSMRVEPVLTQEGGGLGRLVAHLNGIGTVASLGERRLFVDVPWAAVAHGIPGFVPGRNTVLLLRDVPLDDPLIGERLEQLRDDGFTLGLVVPAEFDPDRLTLGAFRYFWIDLQIWPLKQLPTLMAALRGHGSARFALAGVDSPEMLAAGEKAQVSYFSGPWFGREEAIQGGRPCHFSPSFARLTRQLSQGAGPVEIERELKQDATLVYRLLHYINSPWFGVGFKVASVKHAVMLLGQAGMLRWLGVAVLSGCSFKGNPQLLSLYEQAVFRGRFMELIADRLYGRERGDLAYLIGAFSLLDRIFDLPREQLVRELDLPEDARVALMGGQNWAGELLQFARSIEMGHQPGVEWELGKRGVSAELINQALVSGFDWAMRLAVEQEGAHPPRADATSA